VKLIYFILKTFLLVGWLPLFFRVGEVSTCLEKYYIFPQSYIRKLALVREVSFRKIQKKNILIIFYFG
uniref:Uncharacterized protein n=1 Tax=Catagonus wagneri TaxID=51154 RepID=A0A8C3VWF9_9CETA